MSDLIAYRRRTERLVEFKACSRLPTDHGEFQAHGFRSVLDGREHIALVMGDVPADGRYADARAGAFRVLDRQRL